MMVIFRWTKKGHSSVNFRVFDAAMRGCNEYHDQNLRLAGYVVTVNLCMAIVIFPEFVAEGAEWWRFRRRMYVSQRTEVSRSDESAQLRLVLMLGAEISRISDSTHIKVWTLDHMPFHCVLPTVGSST